MKKILLLFCTILIMSSMLHAQNETYKSTICVNAGFSLVGALLSVADGTKSAIPAIQVTYDYGVANWFSLGGAFSFQSMSVDGTDNNGSYTTSIKRMNIAARGLFHYANTGNLDLYSGVRMGYTNWDISTNSTDPSYNSDDVVSGTSRFAIQVVAFGVRGYFNDHFGVNAEFAIGAPHYLSCGLNYRF